MPAKSKGEIESIPWFNGLSDGSLAYLTSNSRIQRFPARTVLFVKGDVPDVCYIALEGSIELFVASGTKEVSVDMSAAPSAYTMAAVLTNAPYIVSGKTIGAAKLLMIDAKALRHAARTETRVALNLLGLVCSQFRSMVRQVVNLKSKSTPERLGCYLLSLMSKDRPVGRIDMPVEGRRLASQLGMTTMSLSRAFKTLALHGVERRGNSVRITGPDELRRFCRPDDLIHHPERDLRFPAD
jgi:CRP/FNR family transcriptional regulator, transcriptional activator FtrB